jgi:hypothetical protein
LSIDEHTVIDHASTQTCNFSSKTKENEDGDKAGTYLSLARLVIKKFMFKIALKSYCKYKVQYNMGIFAKKRGVEQLICWLP